ncbi:MAG: adenylate/guanylate cyclase domain-containing protein [Nitrospirota bacterium]
MSAAITLVFALVEVARPPVIRDVADLLEMKTLDIRFRLRYAHRGAEQRPDDVVIVGIDEASLAAVGRWPWPRAEMARLVDAIAAGHPRAVALDILFAEPEVSESARTIEAVRRDYAALGSPDPRLLDVIGRRAIEGDADLRFADALGRAGRTVLPVALVVPPTYQTDPAGPPPDAPPVVVESSFGLVKAASRASLFRPIEAEAMIAPIEPLARAASALGHVYYQPDLDGVLRWEYLMLQYGDEYYPSFGLQIARAALGLPREAMRLVVGEAIELGAIRIPTDERGRVLINYEGREGEFLTIPAIEVLSRPEAAEQFRDRIVLVGATALGTHDIKVTPLSANLPGVEKNATVVHNLLHGNVLRRTDAMKLLDAGFVLIFGASLGMILPRVSALRGVSVAAGLLLGYGLIAQAFFELGGLWINVLYPSMTIVLCYTGLTVLRFMTEERRAQEIRRLFASYVSPKMVAELVKDPDKAKLGGQRKELTVMFSDVRGFTNFSEQNPPERVVAILNEYLTAMTEVVFRWDGTLDKFIGDAIMAFWGAPVDQPDHAELAVRCALDMRRRLAELQAAWRAAGTPQLNAGIGINTGEMVVGNTGAEGKKMDYTVIGDHVNLAARVESLTRKYNAGILVSDSTYRKIKDLVLIAERHQPERRRLAQPIIHPNRRTGPMAVGHVTFTPLGEVEVKGRAQPVGLYEVIDARKEPS